MADRIKLIDKFYAGIVRDDASDVVGALSNAEEVDIFSNQNYIQPEQVMSADNMPENTNVFAYTAGDDGTVYGYGGETTGNKVRIVRAPNGGSDFPGTFSTIFTSADTVNLSNIGSDFAFFRSTEATNPTSLYYIQGAGSNWYLQRYNLGAAQEQTWNGTTWVAGTANTNSRLTGLTEGWTRTRMAVIFGELFICHGRYIAKVDKDGVFTEKAWTAPQEWEIIDIVGVSDVALVLCRNKNRALNITRLFWWDLTTTAGFEGQVTLAMGGPQWLLNYKETIFIFCAANGVGRFYVMQALPGAQPRLLDNILLPNIVWDTSVWEVSSPKMVATKDGIIYFAFREFYRRGIYALGQLDSSKPYALVFSRRLGSSYFNIYDYNGPVSLFILGPNFYVSYLDNGVFSHARCATRYPAHRSSNAFIETPWMPLDNPFSEKNIKRIYLICDRLPTDTSLSLSIAADFSPFYTTLTRPNGSILNTPGEIFGFYIPNAFTAKRYLKVKVGFTSNGTDAPKLRAIGIRYQTKTPL